MVVLQTALLIACGKGHAHIMKYLLDDAKANINHADKYGFTSLMLAARAGDDECVALLIERKADALIKNVDNATAFSLAKLKGEEKTAELVQAAMTEQAASQAEKQRAERLAKEQEAEKSAAAAAAKKEAEAKAWQEELRRMEQERLQKAKLKAEKAEAEGGGKRDKADTKESSKRKEPEPEARWSLAL